MCLEHVSSEPLFWVAIWFALLHGSQAICNEMFAFSRCLGGAEELKNFPVRLWDVGTALSSEVNDFRLNSKGM